MALPCRGPYSKLWHPVVTVLKRISLLRDEPFPLGIFIRPIVWTSSNVIPKNQKELKIGIVLRCGVFSPVCTVSRETGSGLCTGRRNFDGSSKY